MRLSQAQMDDWYETGKRQAISDIPPNFGHRSGKHSHYYEMAYHAGHYDGIAELKALKRRITSMST